MLLRNKNNWIIGLFLIFTILPMLIGFGYAICYSFGLLGFNSHGFTLHHWKLVFFSSSFWNSLFVSVYVAASSLIFSVVFALLITIFFVYLTKRLQIEKFNIFYLPLSIPNIIGAFLTFQFLGNSGMISRLLFYLGLIKNIDSFFELVNDKYYIGVIFTQSALAFPFITLLFLNTFLSSKLNELAQLSRTLGASHRQIVWRVLTPILLHNAKPNLILMFIVLFGSFEIPLLLGRQSPMMISVLISQKFKKFNLEDLPQAYVIAVIYILLVFVFVSIFLNTKRAKF